MPSMLLATSITRKPDMMHILFRFLDRLFGIKYTYEIEVHYDDGTSTLLTIGTDKKIIKLGELHESNN